MIGSFVYFVRPVGMDGPIKIGCTKWPERRLYDLMSWSPIDLEIAATIPGDRSLESRIHTFFLDHHIRHEWFGPAADLLRLIERLRSGMPVEEAISLPAKGRSLAKNKRTAEQRRRTSFTHRIRWARAKAEKAAGERRVAPKDVSAIMANWSHVSSPKTPSEQEFIRLEEFLADPVLHSVSLRERYPEHFRPTPSDLAEARS